MTGFRYSLRRHSKTPSLYTAIIRAFSQGTHVVHRVYHAYHAYHTSDSEKTPAIDLVKRGLSKAVQRFGSNEMAFKDMAVRVGRGLVRGPVTLPGYDQTVEDTWKQHIEKSCRPDHGAMYLLAKTRFYKLVRSQV